MTTNNNTDIFGFCCKAYLEGDKKAKITVRTDIAETDYLPADYLFRGFDEMPEHEKAALLEAKGKILDIGACAGSHSLYLQNKGFDVTALDISEGCCEVMQRRGIKKVVCKNIFEYNEQKFDTIFLLMNGIGMAGTLPELPKLLSHLKSLLNDGGQIVFWQDNVRVENDKPLAVGTLCPVVATLAWAAVGLGIVIKMKDVRVLVADILTGHSGAVLYNNHLKILHRLLAEALQQLVHLIGTVVDGNDN